MTFGSDIPRIVEVEPLGDYRLRLAFDDGLVREIDLEDELWGEVFEPLRDRPAFARVFVDDEMGTIAWPNGADLDAAVLHGDEVPAHGRPPRLIREYRRPIGASAE